MRTISAIAASALCAGFVAPLSTARADEGSFRLSCDWDKLAQVMRDGGRALLPQERWQPRGGSSESTRNASEKWVGLSPHLSLVARDWGHAQLLVGHLSLTDEIRLSRSSRMFVTRMKLFDGRVAPFVQAGLGQWRVDTDLVPALPRDTEFAAQLGGGFEYSISDRAALAIEADYTVLYREHHEQSNVVSPHMCGAFAATRVLF